MNRRSRTAIDRTVRAAAVVGTTALLLLGGCSSGSEASDCQTKSGASVCLVTDDEAGYELTATGLRPGSEVQLLLNVPDAETRPQKPLHVVADADGSIETSGVVGVVVGGPAQATISVEATSATGQPVSAVFHR